jgi:hypothetical protein
MLRTSLSSFANLVAVRLIPIGVDRDARGNPNQSRLRPSSSPKRCLCRAPRLAYTQSPEFHPQRRGADAMKIDFTETEQPEEDFFEAALAEHDLRFRVGLGGRGQR